MSGYQPHENEPYMCERQRTYFRGMLLRWRRELLDQAQETIDRLRADDSGAGGDEGDRASRARDQAVELRTRDRARKLLPRIDRALRRIEEGTYGFCEETGEPIGLARLKARPIATLTVEAQERKESRRGLLRQPGADR